MADKIENKIKNLTFEILLVYDGHRFEGHPSRSFQIKFKEKEEVI